MSASGPVVERRYVDVPEDGLRWHVQIAGDGPPLLAVHGAGSSGGSFGPLLPHLTARFRVIAPDLPGHDRTHAPDAFTPSLPRVAAALGRLVDRLDVAPQVALGHSAGAAVLARATLDGALAPGRLVGLAPAIVPLAGVAQRLLSGAARLLTRGPAPFAIALRAGRTDTVVDTLRQIGARLPAADAERYRRLAAQPAHVRGTLRMMGAWDLAPLHRALPHLTIPFLMLAGVRDRAVSTADLRAAADRLPHAQLRVIAGVGHLLHEERPAAIARILNEELDAWPPPDVHST